MSKEQRRGGRFGGQSEGRRSERSCETGRPLVFMEGYDLSSMLADPLSSERCPDGRGKARSTGTSEEGLDHPGERSRAPTEWEPRIDSVRVPDSIWGVSRAGM